MLIKILGCLAKQILGLLPSKRHGLTGIRVQYMMRQNIHT